MTQYFHRNTIFYFTLPKPKVIFFSFDDVIYSSKRPDPRIIQRNLRDVTVNLSVDVRRRTRSVTIRNFPVSYTFRMRSRESGEGPPAVPDGTELVPETSRASSLFHASRTKLTGSGKLVDTFVHRRANGARWKASSISGSRAEAFTLWIPSRVPLRASPPPASSGCNCASSNVIRSSYELRSAWHKLRYSRAWNVGSLKEEKEIVGLKGCESWKFDERYFLLIRGVVWASCYGCSWFRTGISGKILRFFRKNIKMLKT